MPFLPSYQSLAQPTTANDSIGNALGTHGSAARVFYPAYTHRPFRPAVSQSEEKQAVWWVHRSSMRSSLASEHAASVVP